MEGEAVAELGQVLFDMLFDQCCPIILVQYEHQAAQENPLFRHAGNREFTR